jgi:hypothetical protein
LVSFALAGLNSTHNAKYDTALQLYRLEHETDSKKFTLGQLEKKFFTVVEQTARDNALTRIALSSAAQSHHLLNDKSRTNPSGQQSQQRSHIRVEGYLFKNKIRITTSGPTWNVLL